MKQILTALVSCSLAGCSVPIIPAQPQQAVSATFGSTVPRNGTAVDMNWWARIGDAQLTELLRAAGRNSPDLRTAAANIISARAQARQSYGATLPSLDASATATRSGGEGIERTDTTSVDFDASWEIDLFGKASNTARANRIRVKAREADYAGAYVSLAAEVADSYVAYRGCRASQAVYSEALSSQRATLKATQELVDTGLSPESDLALARANVASAEISLQDQTAECDVSAQSIATLVGESQSGVRQILSKGGGLPSSAPFRVSSVPADVLRQRPDVAAAEMDFAAVLLDLKVAEAELYPSLTLGGTLTASK